ncbi:magnesium transporter [bacterium]
MTENTNSTQLLFPKIKELLKNKKLVDLKSLLAKVYAVDIAEKFDEFEDKEKTIIFRLLDKEKSIELFESLHFDDQSFLLDSLKNIEISEILNEMAPDERVDLFQELSDEEMKKFFALMKKEEVEDVKSLIQYSEGTAGSLMTTEVVELSSDMSAREALIKLQDELKAGESEHIYSSYVSDKSGKLLGAVDLQDLVIASPKTLVKNIMTDVNAIKVSADTEDTRVAKLFVKYDLLNVPVVDDQNNFLGAIVFDDIVDLIQSENTKEIYELGKMHIEEGEKVSYASSSSFDLLRRRAGWLLFLLVFDFLTGTVLKTYEHALSSVVALSFFIPMLLDTGGNAGAQVSVSIIRGLAIGDVTFDNAWKIIRKEFTSALFMSLFVGVIAFLRAYLLQRDLLLSLVVGFTMAFIVLLSVATGVFLPLLSKKVGLDPAVLAGPITTSVVDIIGLIVYFNIAIRLLPALGGLL